MSCIDVDPPDGEPDGGALNHDRLTRDLGLDDRQTLRQRVIGVPRWRLRPQQIGEIVPCELLTRFQGETGQEGQMLARAERDLFAGDGEQGGSPETMQLETVSHMSARVLLIRFKIKHPNQRRVNTLIY